MRASSRAAALILAFTLAPTSASPTPSPVPSYTNTTNACSSLVNQYVARGASPQTALTPSEVFACFQEIPINNALAAAQIDWLQPFVQFQTTLAYLKDPPPSYQMPPVDIVGGLAAIKAKVLSNGYTNEYDFELDVCKLIYSARDGHFNFVPGLIGLFTFSREIELVSVSLDGVRTPKIYFLPDLMALGTSNATFTPSAVTSIDGVEVNEQLINLASDAQFQDYDAVFNTQLAVPVVTPPETTSTVGAYSSRSFIAHNDSTLYTFENGSTRVIQNFAFSSLPLRFASGRDFFDKYLLGTPNSSFASPTSSQGASPRAGSTVPGYPLPVPGTNSLGNFVSGYFLQNKSNEDVAVLVISSFDAVTEPEQIGFQKAVQTFLSVCRLAGKKRLVIDVRQNPGGTISLVYDTFRQLFPKEIPYSGTRIRAFDTQNVLGEITSSITNDPATFKGLSQLGFGLLTIPTFAQSYLKTPDGEPYATWHDFYGPNQFHGDFFSNIGSYRLSPNLYTNPITVSGYGNRSGLPPQLFASSNIVLLTDGACSSSCALFSNLLINQGKVTTVTAGGRPSLDPIAVIGGTQGGEALEYSLLKALATGVVSQGAASLDAQKDAAVNRTLAPLLAQSPINFQSFGVNGRDCIAQGDATQTPLQFTKSPVADCRMFYMPGDMFNVSYTWNRVAAGVAAGGKGLCVNGTIAKSSGPAYGTPGVTPANANAAAPISAAALHIVGAILTLVVVHVL